VFFFFSNSAEGKTDKQKRNQNKNVKKRKLQRESGKEEQSGPTKEEDRVVKPKLCD